MGNNSSSSSGLSKAKRKNKGGKRAVSKGQESASTGPSSRASPPHEGQNAEAEVASHSPVPRPQPAVAPAVQRDEDTGPMSASATIDVDVGMSSLAAAADAGSQAGDVAQRTSSGSSAMAVDDGERGKVEQGGADGAPASVAAVSQETQQAARSTTTTRSSSGKGLQKPGSPLAYDIPDDRYSAAVETLEVQLTKRGAEEDASTAATVTRTAAEQAAGDGLVEPSASYDKGTTNSTKDMSKQEGKGEDPSRERGTATDRSAGPDTGGGMPSDGLSIPVGMWPPLHSPILSPNATDLPPSAQNRTNTPRGIGIGSRGSAGGRGTPRGLPRAYDGGGGGGNVGATNSSSTSASGGGIRAQSQPLSWESSTPRLTLRRGDVPGVPNSSHKAGKAEEKGKSGNHSDSNEEESSTDDTASTVEHDAVQAVEARPLPSRRPIRAKALPQPPETQKESRSPHEELRERGRGEEDGSGSHGPHPRAASSPYTTTRPPPPQEDAESSGDAGSHITSTTSTYSTRSSSSSEGHASDNDDKDEEACDGYVVDLPRFTPATEDSPREAAPKTAARSWRGQHQQPQPRTENRSPRAHLNSSWGNGGSLAPTSSLTSTDTDYVGFAPPPPWSVAAPLPRYAPPPPPVWHGTWSTGNGVARRPSVLKNRKRPSLYAEEYCPPHPVERRDNRGGGKGGQNSARAEASENTFLDPSPVRRNDDDGNVDCAEADVADHQHGDTGRGSSHSPPSVAPSGVFHATRLPLESPPQSEERERAGRKSSSTDGGGVETPSREQQLLTPPRNDDGSAALGANEGDAESGEGSDGLLHSEEGRRSPLHGGGGGGGGGGMLSPERAHSQPHLPPPPPPPPPPRGEFDRSNSSGNEKSEEGSEADQIRSGTVGSEGLERSSRRPRAPGTAPPPPPPPPPSLPPSLPINNDDGGNKDESLASSGGSGGKGDEEFVPAYAFPISLSSARHSTRYARASDADGGPVSGTSGHRSHAQDSRSREVSSPPSLPDVFGPSLTFLTAIQRHAGGLPRSGYSGRGFSPRRRETLPPQPLWMERSTPVQTTPRSLPQGSASSDNFDDAAHRGSSVIDDEDEGIVDEDEEGFEVRVEQEAGLRTRQRHTNGVDSRRSHLGTTEEELNGSFLGDGGGGRNNNDGDDDGDDADHDDEDEGTELWEASAMGPPRPSVSAIEPARRREVAAVAHPEAATDGLRSQNSFVAEATAYGAGSPQVDQGAAELVGKLDRMESGDSQQASSPSTAPTRHLSTNSLHLPAPLLLATPGKTSPGRPPARAHSPQRQGAMPDSSRQQRLQSPLQLLPRRRRWTPPTSPPQRAPPSQPLLSRMDSGSHHSSNNNAMPAAAVASSTSPANDDVSDGAPSTGHSHAKSFPPRRHRLVGSPLQMPNLAHTVHAMPSLPSAQTGDDFLYRIGNWGSGGGGKPHPPNGSGSGSGSGSGGRGATSARSAPLSPPPTRAAGGDRDSSGCLGNSNQQVDGDSGPWWNRNVRGTPLRSHTGSAVLPMRDSDYDSDDSFHGSSSSGVLRDDVVEAEGEEKGSSGEGREVCASADGKPVGEDSGRAATTITTTTVDAVTADANPPDGAIAHDVTRVYSSGSQTGQGDERGAQQQHHHHRQGTEVDAEGGLALMGHPSRENLDDLSSDREHPHGHDHGADQVERASSCGGTPNKRTASASKSGRGTGTGTSTSGVRRGSSSRGPSESQDTGRHSVKEANNERAGERGEEPHPCLTMGRGTAAQGQFAYALELLAATEQTRRLGIEEAEADISLIYGLHLERELAMGRCASLSVPRSRDGSHTRVPNAGEEEGKRGTSGAPPPNLNEARTSLSPVRASASPLGTALADVSASTLSTARTSTPALTSATSATAAATSLQGEASPQAPTPSQEDGTVAMAAEATPSSPRALAAPVVAVLPTAATLPERPQSTPARAFDADGNDGAVAKKDEEDASTLPVASAPYPAEFANTSMGDDIVSALTNTATTAGVGISAASLCSMLVGSSSGGAIAHFSSSVAGADQPLKSQEQQPPGDNSPPRPAQHPQLEPQQPQQPGDVVPQYHHQPTPSATDAVLLAQSPPTQPALTGSPSPLPDTGAGKDEAAGDCPPTSPVIPPAKQAQPRGGGGGGGGGGREVSQGDSLADTLDPTSNGGSMALPVYITEDAVIAQQSTLDQDARRRQVHGAQDAVAGAAAAGDENGPDALAPGAVAAATVAGLSVAEGSVSSVSAPSALVCATPSPQATTTFSPAAATSADSQPSPAQDDALASRRPSQRGVPSRPMLCSPHPDTPRDDSPSPNRPDNSRGGGGGNGNSRRPALASSVGQVTCQFCHEPYTSAKVCPVAGKSHDYLRALRREEKRMKKEAQALLREGKVRQAVDLLVSIGLVSPATTKVAGTTGGSSSMSPAREGSGSLRGHAVDEGHLTYLTALKDPLGSETSPPVASPSPSRPDALPDPTAGQNVIHRL